VVFSWPVNVIDIFKKVLPHSVRDTLRPYIVRHQGERAAARESKAVAEVTPFEYWAQGQTSELAFWDRVLTGKHEWPETVLIRTNPNLPLQDYLTSLIALPAGSTAKILDVGAGPLTFLGKKWEGRDVSITAVDANSMHYDRLLAKHGIIPPCRTIFGFAEELSKVVAASTFDLVHARNCIDHSQDPLKAIDEMLHAVKPGCYVFLNHSIREGAKELYEGPHQWDFYPDRGSFYISRPGRETVNVGKLVRGRATVGIRTSPDGPDWFVACLRKELTTGSRATPD